jgi:hypothetical protein
MSLSPIKGLAIVAILLLGLLGGLFHHHESASESAACSYCHVGVQTAPIDPPSALIAPLFAVLGVVTPARASDPPQIVPSAPLVPRAPPSQLIPQSFGRVVMDLSD